MNMKRLVLLVIASVVLIAPKTALASEDDESVKRQVGVVEYGLDGSTEEVTGEPDIGYSEKQVQSKNSNVPNEYYDLFSNNYACLFTNVQDYTYSLVYFHPDSLGRVSFYTNLMNSGGQRIVIRLFRKGNNTCIASWVGNPQSIMGIGFNNLAPSGKYYFKFETYEATSINGKGCIHHPDNPVTWN